MKTDGRWAGVRIGGGEVAGRERLKNHDAELHPASELVYAYIRYKIGYVWI